MQNQVKKLGIGIESKMQGMANWDIDFEVPGKPQALKRHRSFQKGKFKGVYDPSEGDKSDFLVLSMQNKPIVPFDEALFVKLMFFFPRPKAHFRTGKNSHILKESAPENHTGIPDADNLAKFICDSLNGVFWRDDSIISELSVSKIYDAIPRIKIQVFRLHKLKVCIENNLL